MRARVRGGKARRLHLAFDTQIAGGLRMNLRRAVGERRARVDDGRRFADRDGDVVGDVFGFGIGDGCATGT